MLNEYCRWRARNVDVKDEPFSVEGVGEVQQEGGVKIAFFAFVLFGRSLITAVKDEPHDVQLSSMTMN
jgi:hypothetical protein